MNQFRLVLLSGYYLLIVSFPLYVFGQGGLPSKIVPCDGLDCTVCHFAKLAQNLINAGIFITVFLSAVMFAYAGFLYVTNEAIGMKQKAQSTFKNVALGLVVILSAWLVVDTLMKSMLGGGFGPWNDICSISALN